MPTWSKGAKGLPANRPRNGEHRSCEECSQAFYVPLSRIKQSARFCSRACYLQNRWGPSRLKTYICPICGTDFEALPSAQQRTCGKVCGDRLHGINMLGERSHLWRGGKHKDAPYRGIWRQRRAEVLERDGEVCTICGSTDRPQVHHIEPYRYSHSHELDNLTTLCRSCHSREEILVNRKYRRTLLAGRHPGGAPANRES